MLQDANRAFDVFKRYGKDNESKTISSVYSLKFHRILQNIKDPEDKATLLSNIKNLVA